MAARPIITNLDKKLSPEEVRAAEQGERRRAYIDGQIREAEKAEKEGRAAPDVIYTGIQDSGVYTADPVFDKSRAAIQHGTLPVKEFGVDNEGNWVVTLDENSAALEEVRRGVFCVNCTNRQPDNEILWEAAMVRLEERSKIGPRPVGARHGSNCCYCGFRLGIDGDHKQEDLLGMTPDQKRVLETMFGPIAPGASST